VFVLLLALLSILMVYIFGGDAAVSQLLSSVGFLALLVGAFAGSWIGKTILPHNKRL
jgi:uncharacterized membrane protein YfcA